MNIITTLICLSLFTSVVLLALIVKLFNENKTMKRKLNENFEIIDKKCSILFQRTLKK